MAAAATSQESCGEGPRHDHRRPPANCHRGTPLRAARSGRESGPAGDRDPALPGMALPGAAPTHSSADFVHKEAEFSQRSTQGRAAQDAREAHTTLEGERRVARSHLAPEWSWQSPPQS